MTEKHEYVYANPEDPEVIEAAVRMEKILEQLGYASWRCVFPDTVTVIGTRESHES